MMTAGYDPNGERWGGIEAVTDASSGATTVTGKGPARDGDGRRCAAQLPRPVNAQAGRTVFERGTATESGGQFSMICVMG